MGPIQKLQANKSVNLVPYFIVYITLNDPIKYEKRSSLMGPLVGYEENDVFCILLAQGFLSSQK
jgi:hypothetical protein